MVKEIVNVPGYMITNNGEVFSKRNKKPVKHYKNHSGYTVVVLHYKNTIKKFSLHRLLAETFIANPEDKPCVNHINGIKTDYRIENLEWCTYSENIKHAYKEGLRARQDLKGDKNPNSKLSEQEVKDIYEYLKIGIKVSLLCKKYKVTKDTIMGIKRGFYWKSLNLIPLWGRSSSITLKMIDKIEELLLKNMSIREIHKETNFARNTIKNVKNGKYKKLQNTLREHFYTFS